MSNTYFCLTGMSRSGTTLLQTLLNYHKDVYCGLQPFPQLFLDVKKEFHKKINFDELKFVFENYCHQESYKFSDFDNHLNQTQFNSSFINNSIQKEYAGQWEHPVNMGLAASEKNNLSACYKNLLASIVCSQKGIRKVGAKHMLLDEFVPYFCRNAIQCITIIRNPIDVIKSAKYANGGSYIGGILPTLYELQNWKRNLHLTIFMQSNPNFRSIKYESLLEQPKIILSDLFAWLELQTNNVFLSDLIQNILNSKPLNSSFPADSNVEEYLGFSAYSNYVQAICYSEMRYLGYEISIDKNDITDIIQSFVEPIKVTVKGIATDYSSLKSSLEFELEKANCPTPRHYFGGQAVMDELLRE